MTMTAFLRKFALTAHVTSSVGSLGAVVGFLALAIAALTSQDAQMVHAIYLVLEFTAWFVILPLLFASLLTGLVSSLGTTWGLFRHYWVLAKFLMIIVAIVILLVYLMHRQTLSYLAGIAADATLIGDDLYMLRSASPLIHAAGGLLLLLIATVLAVYKPEGVTAYGAHKMSRESASTPRWVRIFGIIALVVVLLLAILIVSGGHRPGRH
jgi:hypothetical protein